VVSLARDVNVRKIKGKTPRNPEDNRVIKVSESKLADKVILGAKTQYISHILKQKPDIIALGYDQRAYTKNLKALLAKKGLDVKIIRLEAHKPHKYKSSLIKT
jgi:FAD synthetase